MFNSKTRRRKKQRVAAGAGSADLGSEVPNLGVARALFVILVLHMAAIAAIFIHNRVTDDAPVTSKGDAQAAAAVVAAPSRERLPVVRQGEDFYFVATGDTYERIARVKGVEVGALRDLNDNVRLKAGRILRIPEAGATAPAPAVASSEAVVTPPTVAPAPAPALAPIPSADVVAGETPSGPPIVVKRTEPARAFRVVVADEDPAPGSATKVTPRLHSGADPVAPAASAPGGRYTVKRGDTAWGIAQRHKVSASNLLKANGITDARKMRVGMRLKIPAH